jgi:hypothetical protein
MQFRCSLNWYLSVHHLAHLDHVVLYSIWLLVHLCKYSVVHTELNLLLGYVWINTVNYCSWRSTTIATTILEYDHSCWHEIYWKIAYLRAQIEYPFISSWLRSSPTIWRYIRPYPTILSTLLSILCLLSSYVLLSTMAINVMHLDIHRQILLSILSTVNSCIFLYCLYE